MKRYMVFSGRDYYPHGGMEDFIGSYEKIDDANSKAKSICIDDSMWAHIYCLVEGRIILDSESYGLDFFEPIEES